MIDSDTLRNSMQSSIQMDLQKSMSFDFGSPLVNTLITTVVLMLFNSFFLRLFDSISFVKNTSLDFLKNASVFKRWNTLRLEGTLCKTKHGGSTNTFSDRFITINDWIISSLNQIDNVKCLKEEDIRKLSESNNCWDDPEKTLILDHSDFLCIDSENDIWVKYSIDEKDADRGEKTTKMLQTKSIIITLRSKKISINQLKKYVESKTAAFMAELQSRNMSKTYFFEFLKMNSDDGFTEFSEVNFETNRRISNVFFSQKNEFLEKFNFFMGRRDWYDRLGIPYHLGILLYGLPGCGKTSLIKAIANETGYQIISIPLSRIKTAKDLTAIFYSERINRKKVPMSKRIYLFEDIDAMQVALKRDKQDGDSSYSQSDASSVVSNDEDGAIPDDVIDDESFVVKKSSKKDDDTNLLASLIKAESSKLMSCAMKDDDPLTLSHLLNLIDGLIEMPGRIIIFTTNHKSKLDPALIRPGRVDIAIEMKKATREITAEMYEWFFEKKLDDAIIQTLPDERFTPAEVSNFFYQFNTRPDDVIDYLKSFGSH